MFPDEKTSRRGDVHKHGRIFSFTMSMTLISSMLLIGITVHVPNTSAAILTHDNGNLWVEQVTDFGRILKGFTWQGQPQDVRDPIITFGYIGLVMDQDNYDHDPGTLNIADSYYSVWPYAQEDDLTHVTSLDMVIDDGTIEKSYASLKNTGAGTGDPNDILINQTTWTVINKDWAIIQWSLLNMKTETITNISFGLELPLSIVGANGGVGGDPGDDHDGYDPGTGTYWVQDDSGTTIGFGPGIASDPITHYFSADYHDTYTWDEYKLLYTDDTWLYNRLHAPNSVVGATPGNRSSSVGWDDITLGPGSSRTLTLVVAVNSTFGNMITALKDAQYYYKHQITGFRITEFSDGDSGTQRIEVYNYGRGATNMSGEGFFLSVDGGSSQLAGSWDKVPLPIYEYGVFTLDFGENIGQEGGTIGLYKDDGVDISLMDEVSFGRKGTAPDPLGGESVARRYGAYKIDFIDEWIRNGTTGPTWGAANDIGDIIPSPQVVLNRVMFNPNDPAEAYVELMYTGGSPEDISGYRIVCDNEFIIPFGTVLDQNSRYFVLNRSKMPVFFANMNNTSDNVYLYDNSDNLLDMVGWSSLHTKGRFMSRMPEGAGTHQGFDDSTSMLADWVFDQVPTMMITEFSPDSEQVEIYNPRGGDKVPGTPGTSTWKLSVEGGDMIGNWGPDPIPSGSYSVFTRTGGAPINNEGDVFDLIFTEAVPVESVPFGTRGVAPDPPLGNSTARYWDDGIIGYSDEWTKSSSSGPTWGSQNDVFPINPSPLIILNEVMFNPIAPDGGYVVIINKGLGGTINIKDYYVVCDNVYQLSGFGDILLDSFERHIIKYNGADPALTALFQNMTAQRDNVYLLDNNGLLLDMVGWNSPHAPGMSVRRVPDGGGAFQGHNDTTSEAAGWVFDSSLQVLVTEISDNESAVAHIELYNPWYPPINFGSGDFYIDSGSYGTLSGIWSIPTANPDGYALFNVTIQGGLNPEGDTITLFQKGVVIEQISYGLAGTVPDPLPDESVARYWDGFIYTDVWERNWTMGPTFGFQNDVPMANLT
ncbi:MAG: lamin tail domain-containing protein [Thermoplasmata archaeon]|nr:MAG: lamin tail domain-containing protein [Thermoplasmata archaeon]